MTDAQKTTLARREMAHLIAMCDGKTHTFFDHEKAAELKWAGLIARDSGGWVITQAGKEAVING